MCEFALSRDVFRFSVVDFTELMPKAHAAGVRYVRFTGGEPLMHNEVVELVGIGTAYSMKMSIITNGMMLPRMLDRLITVDRRLGAKHTLAVHNCTEALRLALISARPRLGDLFFIPAVTFVAVAGAVLSSGLIPVLVDVDEH